jgi:hypothetical protein
MFLSSFFSLRLLCFCSFFIFFSSRPLFSVSPCYCYLYASLPPPTCGILQHYKLVTQWQISLSMQYEVRTQMLYGVKKKQCPDPHNCALRMSGNHDSIRFGCCWWILASSPMSDMTPNFERKCSPVGKSWVLLAFQVRKTNPIFTFQDTVSRTYTALEQMRVLSQSFKQRPNLTEKVNSYNRVLINFLPTTNIQNNVTCSEII